MILQALPNLMNIQTRLFLVGCPRSGTTLLQSMIAAHSEIQSFPESHFFVKLLKFRKHYQKLLGLAPKDARIQLGIFVAQLDKKFSNFNPVFPTAKWFSKEFVSLLDQVTLEENKCVWLEKTPDHVFFTRQISKLVPKVKFIHIIRNGTDVVASLYDVGKKYPKIWHGDWSIEGSVHHWKSSVDATMQNWDSTDQHLVVFFSDLLLNPEKEIKKICDFIQVDFQENMLDCRNADIEKLITKTEEWKSDVGNGVKRETEDKFTKLFSIEEQNYIRSQLEDYTVEKLQKKYATILAQ